MDVPDEQEEIEYHSPAGMPGTPELNRWLETNEDLFQQIEHDLSGEVLMVGPEGQLQWIRKGDPLLNEIGVRFFISQLRLCANKNINMSNISSDRVLDICRRDANDIAEALFFSGVHYGLKAENFRVINGHAIRMLELSLRRAVGEGERKFLGGAQRENINRIIDGREQKKSYEFWK